MKVLAYGYVKGGKLHILNRLRLTQGISEMKNCDVQIEIKKKGKRSLPQNAYYWGVVVPEITHRLRELGNDVNGEVVHEYLKGRFNSNRIVVAATGEALDIPKSTTELNKEEFGSYVDRIIQFCAESLDLVIPPPNTQTAMFDVAVARYDYDLKTTIVSHE